MAPTPTLPQGLTRLLSRQEPTTTVIVDSNSDSDSSSGGSGLSGGAIAGIVIGCVVGILLLWWIIRSCTTPRVPDSSRQGWYDDTVPPPRSRHGSRSRSRSVSHGRHHHHHSHHHHSARHHSRRRSSTPRPVVYEEKYTAAPRRPSAAYVYPAAGDGRRSRSRSQGRYYVSG